MCPVCEQRFLENSLPLPLVERLGMDRRNFYAPCLRDSLLSPGDDHLGREEALQYLRDLSAHMGGIPNQGFGGQSGNLDGLNDEERLKLIRLNLRKPSVRRVKELFGSWLQGLIAASVLEDRTRPTVYGTQTVARDGHICFSLGEKTIDDFLYQHGIKHEKEPPYPDSSLRADFRVGDTLIEYFGLAGNPDYNARAEEKKRICKRHDIPLIAIYPQDLAGAQRLRRKLAGLLPDDTNV
jgi:hypothetical protein